MKCGDIVRNHWAGDHNPSAYFMFVRYSGKYVIGMDGKGKEHRYYRRDVKDSSKYEVVGHVDLSELKRYYDEALERWEKHWEEKKGATRNDRTAT